MLFRVAFCRLHFRFTEVLGYGLKQIGQVLLAGEIRFGLLTFTMSKNLFLKLMPFGRSHHLTAANIIAMQNF
jgi:hypothetical protein